MSAEGPTRSARVPVKAAHIDDREAEPGARALTLVAVGILRRPDGQVLFAQRPPGKVYAGYWEFPGGKIEAGESSLAALERELVEELGVRVRHAQEWLAQRHDYPHAYVELRFFLIDSWDGDVHPQEGQVVAWQTPGAYTVTPMLPALLTPESKVLPELLALHSRRRTAEPSP